MSRDDLAPHILYVAWAFPPARLPGVYRALATANTFAKRGCRVTVLTADRETFERLRGTDTSLEPMIDPSIEVVRIPFASLTEPDLRRWSLARILFPRLWLRARRLNQRMAFPDAVFGGWARPLRRVALAIHRKHPVDLVVATADPNVDFDAARTLHRKAGVPYVLDYRDTWLLDLFNDVQTYADNTREARMEAELIAHALEVWFVNKPICAWHQDRYPAQAERMHVVANGYDPDFAPQPNLSTPPPDRGLKFGYIGSIHQGVPLSAFLSGWVRARETTPDSFEGSSANLWGYLGLSRTPDADIERSILQFSSHDVHYFGPLQKASIAETYEKLDALLLILAKGAYVTSGKVFEYAATALPIVSVHDPQNAASTILRDYPLWFPVSAVEPDAIASALCRAAKAARTAGPEMRRECYDYALQFRRDRQLQPRVDHLIQRIEHQS